jgi:hypothetical protein
MRKDQELLAFGNGISGARSGLLIDIPFLELKPSSELGKHQYLSPKSSEAPPNLQ